VPSLLPSSTAIGGTVFNAGTVFWTNALGVEPNIFYAYPSSVSGSVPVYQYHAVQSDGSGWRFFYSTDANVGWGWTLDGPVFYVPASR
jgi:hypothetical protein